MPFLFYLHGLSYKERFNSKDAINYEYKVRAIGSNISLDRFYSNIDSVSVINELIDISQPNKDDKTIFILRKKKKNIAMCVVFLVMPFLFYLYGSSYKETFNSSDIVNFDYKVRAIGSNINLDRFYSNIDPVLVINELIDISQPNKDDKTIFVWPEGILPDVSQEELIEFKWLFEDAFSKNHLLFIGINSQKTNKEKIDYFNSLSIYDHNLEILNFYNKINLVPFGEFLPFENILKKFGLSVIANNYESFSKGNKRKVIEIKRDDFSLKI